MGRNPTPRDLPRAPITILPTGLATGIGHLPHFDPSDAVEFVLRHSPKLPFAPALPARSRREGMVAQAAAGVPGLTVLENGSLEINREAIDPEAPLDHDVFSGDAYVGLRAFLTAVADRDGPIKVSVTGPVTFGMALHAAGLDADLAFRLAGSVVQKRIAAIVDHVLRRVPQAQIVVFVDEPAMGSLAEEGFPIGPTAGVDLVSGTMAIVEPIAITGLHCCTPADYRLLLGTGPRILSVPLDGGIERHSGLLGDFIDRGGWIAWGAVPTDGPVGTTVDRLWRRLSKLWSDLADEGCDPALLRTNALITPVCGLAHHGVTQAEHVMELTSQLAQRLQAQANGVRSSVGA
jgi:methionine synthase II (cobalamin-independent)